MPVAAWARDPNGVLAMFAADGGLVTSEQLGAVPSASCSD
jgi:hypothetical protein